MDVALGDLFYVEYFTGGKSRLRNVTVSWDISRISSLKLVSKLRSSSTPKVMVDSRTRTCIAITIL